MNEQIEVMTETEKIGMRSRSKGRIGIGFVELAAHEQCADDDQQNDAYSDIAGFEAVRVTFDRSDQQSEVRAFINPSRQSKWRPRMRTGFLGRNR